MPAFAHFVQKLPMSAVFGAKQDWKSQWVETREVSITNYKSELLLFEYLFR